MEDNEIAAKRHKKRKTDCFYAPFASFCGYSLFPLCRLCCGLLSNLPRATLATPLQIFPGPTDPTRGAAGRGGSRRGRCRRGCGNRGRVGVGSLLTLKILELRQRQFPEAVFEGDFPERNGA